MLKTKYSKTYSTSYPTKLCCSSDFSKILVASYNDYPKLSTNYGFDYSNLTAAPIGNIYIACSSDASVICNSGNNAKRSFDTGSTWKSDTNSITSLTGSAVSYNGLHRGACKREVYVWENWTSDLWRLAQKGSLNLTLKGLIISPDGATIITWTNNYIYVSTDSGVNYTQRGSLQDYQNVVANSDFTFFIAYTRTGIYTSTDTITWTLKFSYPGNSGAMGSSSYDCKYSYVIYDYTNFYFSKDYGENWTIISFLPVTFLVSSVCSSDNTRLLVAAGVITDVDRHYVIFKSNKDTFNGNGVDL
jgi:hypothetical protein